MKLDEIILKYPLEEYDISMIRYAAYTMSSDFWVFITKSKNEFEIRLIPKKDLISDYQKVKKRFEEELRYEVFRQKILKENNDFRFNIIKKAITYNPPTEESFTDTLTPEEQKELERLIKEAEEEIKKELKKEKEDDIRKTWEEKYGAKNR